MISKSMGLHGSVDVVDEPSPIAQEREAIDRIARTNDGRLLNRYLRRVLETVVLDDNLLQTHNGRRSLARDLMNCMAQGIEDGSGRRDIPRGDESLLRLPRNADGGQRTASRRRVEPDPAVAAFLREHDIEPSS
jgi:hypothetical protein